MKVNSLELCWFRGASSKATLECNHSNIVIYGLNGSGKSSFVDSIEYLIDGKIEHLRHEYSGRKQEKSIRNTLMPSGTDSIIELTSNKGSIKMEIKSNGATKICYDPPSFKEEFNKLTLEKYVLRQDQLSNFIHKPKGEKYSVLLPLLGLGDYDQTEKNIETLIKTIREKSQLKNVERKYESMNIKIEQKFISTENKEISMVLDRLSDKYEYKNKKGNLTQDFSGIYKKVKYKIEQIQPEYIRYNILSKIYNEKLDDKYAAMLFDSQKLEGESTVLIESKLEILEETDKYISKLSTPAEEEVICPACGQTLKISDFKQHVDEELKKLKNMRSLKNKYLLSKKEFQDAYSRFNKTIDDESIKDWLRLPENKIFDNYLNALKIIDASKLEQKDIITINDKLPKFLSELAVKISNAPPSIQELQNDEETIKLGMQIPSLFYLKIYSQNVTNVLQVLTKCQEKLHEEMQAKATQRLSSISSKIQELWSKLHPNELIKNIQLYLPINTDEAIDISLEFYGVFHESPRIALSEGHRNSLGLCIFLALALQIEDSFIILDDIVSSIDRQHRVFVIDILQNDLKEKQIILFTHDREWFTELRIRLPPHKWKFMSLRPWIDPSQGIQWSNSKYTLDDARLALDQSPEQSGNTARGILDIELSLITERLKVSLPYLRGDKNDLRGSVEFLEKLLAESKKRLKIKDGDHYVPYKLHYDDWENTKQLSIVFGNTASHGRMIIKSEAEMYINNCEKTLNHFQCSNCKTPFYTLINDKEKYFRCDCGNLKWAYG
jgi:hypothetical protein